MKKQIIFIVLICLLVLPTLVNADSDLVFKRGTEIDLKIPCVFEDVAYCDNVAKCNLTINYPNGTNLISEGAMTYNPSYFNYTLTTSQTNVIGVYPSTMICEDRGAVGFTSFSYEITSTGGFVPETNTIPIVLLIMFGLFLFFFILGLTSQRIPVAVTGLLLGGIFLLIVFQVAIISPDVQSVQILKDQLGTIYDVLGILFVAFVIIMIIVLFAKIIQWNKYNKKSHLRNWGLLDESEI